MENEVLQTIIGAAGMGVGVVLFIFWMLRNIK